MSNVLFTVNESNATGFYLAEGPSQFNLVHPPQLVNVFSQFVADVVQMRWEDNLRVKTIAVKRI